MNSQGNRVPTFSRLQLAAALIEYDNDPNDPNPPRRAQDSAIFSRLRTPNPAQARKLTGYDHLRQTPDHLGVQLPVNDAASTKLAPPSQHALAGSRSSKGSIDLLRNPFGADVESEAGREEGQGSEDEPEVDLEAWGMSSLLEDKDLPRSRQQRERRLSKAHSEVLPNPYSPASPTTPRPPFQQHSKAKSLGGLGDKFEPLEGPLIASEADFRRRTISVPLDPTGRATPDFQKPLSIGSPRMLPNRPALQHHPLSPSPNHIPFPIALTPEPEQGEEETNVFELPLTAPISRFDPKSHQARTTSRGSRHSLGSQSKLALDPDDPDNPQDEDVFTPNPDRASRFDVDFGMNDLRPLSLASFGGTVNTLQADLAGESERALSPEQMLAADMRAAHTRTISNASLGSRLPLENEPETGEERGDRPTSRRFSRLDLLRPKVLIMPSPLQNLEERSVPQSADVPAGFQLATLGPPLPPGAQTGSPSTLTPNPRLSLTLSQLTFRNSLITDGQRDITFVDIEKNLRRAEKDGEQIIQEEDIEEEIAQEQRQAHGRPAGKLYGRSLMDELQARKEKLKSKKRVFTGDQRPPMMTRGDVRRSATLIDPATLRDLPLNQAQGKNQDESVDLQRRPSRSKPLLTFDNQPGPSGAVRTSSATFGHDKLWEQEMQRRKQIEAVERAEEEEEQRREAAKTAKKKAKKKLKEETQAPKAEPAQPARRMSVVPDLPPTLPSIPTTTARRAPPPVQDESESDSDSEASLRAAKLKSAMRVERTRSSQDWLSSDDEIARPKKVASPVPRLPSGSDEDLPLSTLARGSIRPIQVQPSRNSDSEDEQPLSTVMQKKLTVHSFGFQDFSLDAAPSSKKAEEENEDNVPLAVRHPQARGVSVMSPQTSRNDDDDDKPLGLKQLESQQLQQMQYHNMLAAQQHMMMMQPSMAMSFTGPPVMNGFTPYMMTPQHIFAPQPVRPDNAKLQSVDRWRHSVEN